MVSNQKKILLLILAGLLSISLVTVAFWFQYPQKNPQAVVLIEKGSTPAKVASVLYATKVLDSPLLFKTVLYGTLSWRDLKAGEYFIPANVTPAQLIHILKSGEVILYPLTVIEGETSQQFTQKLLKDDRFKGESDVPLEGRLLPETYFFSRGTDRKKIVLRLEKAMTEALNEAWTKRAPDHPLQSPEELLILASIIEKETRLESERPIVAAVFLNRLKQNMPLQADPTVLYGLQKVGKELSLSDLQKETPYNTYLIQGLPPTPIANPGRASLKAAARPAEVSYLYFVADGSGGHVFATTLEEHKKNHSHWRKIRETQKK